MSSRGDLNARWADAFVAELHEAGLRQVVVSPGSRSTPLVLALARHGGFHLRVQLDERSAGFLALGMGKGEGRPAAVVTTSGTATANLFPAVVESAQGETPLVVLTADRPHRLRGADANQAIDQVGLYGAYPRAFFEVAPPSDDPRSVRHLRDLAHRAVATADGRLDGVPGPVHLNFPFDKPLEPGEARVTSGEPGATHREPGPTEGVRIPAFPEPPPAPEQVRELARRLERARRPLLVAGPGTAGGGSLGRDGGVRLQHAAVELGLPLLADPLSGARYGSESVPGSGIVVTHYDPILRDRDLRTRLRPDLVIRMGNAPTSAPLLQALEEWSAAEQIVVARPGRYRDHAGTADEYWIGDGPGLLWALLAQESDAGAPAAEDYTADWKEAEHGAASAALPPEFVEGWVAREVVRGTPDGASLFLSSSMPIRDVDAFGAGWDRPIRALGNRGASGIDGVVSTALGVALDSERPLVALLGDLALFHDQNGLLAARDVRHPVALVVVHNDGGGIFHRLPVARHEPHFTPFFATPHGLDFRHAAAMFGLRYRTVNGREDLAMALEESLGENGVSLIVVSADRGANHDARLRTETALAQGARRALGLD